MEALDPSLKTAFIILGWCMFAVAAAGWIVLLVRPRAASHSYKTSLICLMLGVFLEGVALLTRADSGTNRHIVEIADAIGLAASPLFLVGLFKTLQRGRSAR